MLSLNNQYGTRFQATLNAVVTQLSLPVFTIVRPYPVLMFCNHDDRLDSRVYPIPLEDFSKLDQLVVEGGARVTLLTPTTRTFK